MHKKILLLEDEINLGETIRDILVKQNYQVDYVSNGNQAIDKSYDTKYDLYIFDINVPDIDGLDILQSLRDAHDLTPTIFISAMTDLQTVLKSFEVGAYDFIKKPFFIEELVIKVNLKLSTKEEKIVYNDLEYFPNEKKVLKAGKLISLGEIGSLVFELFIKNINRIITKEEIYESLESQSATALRFHVSNIKKLTGLKIQNIRGVGYIIEKS